MVGVRPGALPGTCVNLWIALSIIHRSENDIEWCLCRSERNSWQQNGLVNTILVVGRLAQGSGIMDSAINKSRRRQNDDESRRWRTVRMILGGWSGDDRDSVRR